MRMPSLPLSREPTATAIHKYKSKAKASPASTEPLHRFPVPSIWPLVQIRLRSSAFRVPSPFLVFPGPVLSLFLRYSFFIPSLSLVIPSLFLLYLSLSFRYSLVILPLSFLFRRYSRVFPSFLYGGITKGKRRGDPENEGKKKTKGGLPIPLFPWANKTTKAANRPPNGHCKIDFRGPSGLLLVLVLRFKYFWWVAPRLVGSCGWLLQVLA